MGSDKPLVSVICLCYKQASFVEDALESVWAQTYPHVELIVVDDGSSDNSVEVIRRALVSHPDVQFLALPENQGNCRAFNQGLALSSGKYIIDLAADDVLLPERVAEGVKALEAAGEEYAVNFTDVTYIDPLGVSLRGHYKRDRHGKIREKVPQGWVYEDILSRYFISSPSMLMRRLVLEAVGGYDESLAYEDFDFWLRSSRYWKYCFTDRTLVKKRIVPGSWSTRQYEKQSRQLESTLKICRKAQALNRHKSEEQALGRRLSYEIRQAIRKQVFDVAGELLELKKEVKPNLIEDQLYAFFIKRRLSFL